MRNGAEGLLNENEPYFNRLEGLCSGAETLCDDSFRFVAEKASLFNGLGSLAFR